MVKIRSISFDSLISSINLHTLNYVNPDTESTCNVGDTASIPGSGRSPGEGNGKSLHHSCLENSMDRGAWQATVQGVHKESNTAE